VADQSALGIGKRRRQEKMTARVRLFQSAIENRQSKMACNEYHFISHWEVEGTVEEVSTILEDTPSLARWWPSVYLEVQVLEPGDETGKGKVVNFTTKGWLPYTVQWQSCLIESRRPHGFSLEASGDFLGLGVWSFKQDGSHVRVVYDWRVRAEKPLLRTFSFLLKPLFSANHRWAMAQGEKSLRLELARRRSNTDEDLAQVPAPPGPTAIAFPAVLLAAAGVLAAGGLLFYLLVK
jgi:hypothetical protein